MIDMKNNRKLFNDYFKTFDIHNAKILGKFHHSYRVMEYAKEIAKSLNLSEDKIMLASTCALLHDISRFIQIKSYDTFLDSESFDHGDKSYEILKENNFINKFTNDEYEQKMILVSVKNHNKFKIEDNLSDDELLFCKIVRDADKIDIMIEQSNSINDGIYEIKKSLLDDIYNKRLCNNDNTETQIDYVLRTISFIFDMNYNYSLQYLIDKNIIKNKFNILESNVNIEELKEYLNDYLKLRCKNV